MSYAPLQETYAKALNQLIDAGVVIEVPGDLVSYVLSD
jgi:hypothetical protein